MCLLDCISCLLQAPCCQDWTTKHKSPLSSYVSHKFAFTPKAKHNSEWGPVLYKIYKLSVHLGTEATSSWCSTPIMPSDASRILTGASYFFLNDSPVLTSLCHSLLLTSQIYRGCKASHFVPNISKSFQCKHIPPYMVRTQFDPLTIRALFLKGTWKSSYIIHPSFFLNIQKYAHCKYIQMKLHVCNHSLRIISTFMTRSYLEKQAEMIPLSFYPFRCNLPYTKCVYER